MVPTPPKRKRDIAVAIRSALGQLCVMDVIDLVAQVRDHFLNQFGAFVERQQELCPFGSPEVKLQLSETSGVYQRLYCVDFIKPAEEDDEDDEAESEGGVVEFQPEFFLEFEPTSGGFGAMAVTIEELRWHDVVFYHDLPKLPDELIAQWFEAWFDPEDERYDPESRFAGIIHTLLLDYGEVSVDFGTAPVEAFWDMLELLEASGAKNVRIACADEETDA
jgi:hypothetical protein